MVSPHCEIMDREGMCAACGECLCPESYVCTRAGNSDQVAEWDRQVLTSRLLQSKTNVV